MQGIEPLKTSKAEKRINVVGGGYHVLKLWRHYLLKQIEPRGSVRIYLECH